MSPVLSLEGKTAIVTGGAGGLGLSITDLFLEAGANVVAIDINTDLVQKFESSHDSSRAIAVEANVTLEEDLEDLFKTTIKKFGKIDIIVNNAGVTDRLDPVGTLEKDLWDRIIAVNLTAPMMVTKLGVNHMMEKQIKGSIINIGSVAALRAAYTASKHGLVGLKKNTAAFYTDKGIRCNAVLPSGMETNISKTLTKGINDEGYCHMMKGPVTMVDPKQVAQTVLFLASDASNTVSGSCIATDLGYAAS
ncbi:NAD(P)-binding protein [Aureobasidium pullulans]|nr:NAD(P)-binding protein [Aureobasidium pullulans]